MSIITRIFTLLSLVVLLLVANVALRVYEWTHSSTVITLEIPQIDLLDLTPAKNTHSEIASFAQEHFEQQVYLEPIFGTKIAQRTKSLPKIEFKKIDKKIDIFEEAWGDIELNNGQSESWKEIRGDVALPVQENFEPQKVAAVSLPTSTMVALFDGFKYEEMAVAKVELEEVKPVIAEISEPTKLAATKIVEDRVSTISAKSEDQELAFFEYEEESELSASKKSEVTQPQIITKKQAEIFDYSQPAPTVSSVDQAKVAKENVEFFNLIQETQMPTNNTKAQASVKAQPLVAATTQPSKKEGRSVNALVTSHHNALTVVHGLSVSSQVKELRYFDLRAVDDGQSIFQDNGTSEVVLKETLQSINNSRSFLLLNREHVVTHVDVPFAPGRADLTVPALEKEFAEKFQVRNQKIPRGMVLVELDERTENIKLDGAAYATSFLDEKFKEVKPDSATYVMFYGVEIGNRTLLTVDSRGKSSPRIIHVFEEELTFDPNLYLEQKDLVVTLKEEGLMSQRGKELAIAADDVSLTLSNVKSERMGINTYKLKTPALLMGSRHYLTLTHQREEIFVGVDDSKAINVPSEELITAVIGKFKLQGHASACLIQVNLDRPAKKYDVMAESHQETHVSYALVLDKDGGFYESMGEDSKKLFIMSESQAGEAFTQNAKINIKIDFLDGTSKTFSSFCSPNTYLVEQL
jgi:hypothetical protein